MAEVEVCALAEVKDHPLYLARYLAASFLCVHSIGKRRSGPSLQQEP